MRWPIVVLLAAAAACASAPAPARPARVGAVPDIPVRSLAGHAQVLRGLAGGRPLVVDFFATWCEPCRDGIPRLRRLQAAHPEVAVVGIDIGEEPELVADFALRERMSYPVFTDRDFQLADACSVHDIPAILVIAGDGRIIYRGSHVDAALEAALRSQVATTAPAR